MKSPFALAITLLLLSPAAAFADDAPGASPAPLPIRHVTVDVHKSRHLGIYPGSCHVEQPPFARHLRPGSAAPKALVPWRPVPPKGVAATPDPSSRP